jgi:uncharacterized protein (DUF342 family)
MDVLGLVESYGIIDVDYVIINDMMKSSDDNLEFKISDNKTIRQVNESAAVEVSSDRMSAFIVFSPPINKGKPLTISDIYKIIEQANIKRILHGAVEKLAVSRRYEHQILIGEGKDPVPGTDGYLQYHFDRSHLRPKPKIMDDGSVNFHQLGLLKLVNRGDVLVTSIPPSEGEPGEDVYGVSIPYPSLKPAQPIPKGKNTTLSDDGFHLIADVSGQLLLQDGKINLSPSLDIPGDVGTSTGDIEFNGEVHIRGSVKSGFKVIAEGNIEVFGVCEAATLTSKGSIILNSGAQGADKAFLSAEKDITAKFIENSTVTAGGNITADSILKSSVKCDGTITLTGKNGLLSGGHVVAGEKLIAKTIGSPMGTSTDIEVGGNPRELQRHKELVEEYNNMKNEFERCDAAITTLNGLKQRNILSDDKKAVLIKMINTKMQLRDKMNKTQDQLDELVRVLTTNTGTVSVSRVIRPGVRVSIGNAQLNIREELSNCRLRNDGSKISIGPNL